MAERHEIIDALEGLAVHCRLPLMSVDDRSRWMADWCADLREYPIDSIRTACQRWRHGDNTKFPIIGQFLPLVRAVTAKPKVETWGEWKPLSDEAYEALSLDDKIRHHQIMAVEARKKAGAQWANGAPVAAEDMPERWHGWRAKAANHDAEAKRLMAYRKSA